MPKRVITGDGVPPSSYPFSQLVEANGLVFLAGQVGDDRASDAHGPVPGGFEAEARAMFENVGRLLRVAGLDYADVVQTTMYLVDFDDFPAMNAVYREYFPTDPPTRATLGVTRLASTYRIEIVCVAARR